MGCRNLTDAAPSPRRGGSDSTVTRTCRATGEALLVPARNRRSRVDRITGSTGKSIDGERVVLRGWVNYFAVGHSSACFCLIKDWVEKKVRRHMLRARKRKGFGWTRWSRPWLYDTLKLFNGYRVRRPEPKVAPAR